MKRFSFYVIIIAGLCCLFAWSAPNLHADSVTLSYTGVGGPNSGGVYTYPYLFTVTPTGGGQSFNLSLMCLSFEREITTPETWTANVATAGSFGALASTYEMAAYLYTQAVANPSSGAANWAAWSLFESSTLSGRIAWLSAHLSAGQELADAENFLKGLSSINLADYANYDVFTPVDGTQSSGGPPQYFIGLITPEPGSLLLLGTGLFGLAILLYLQRRHHVDSI